jgi:hypothetical protein
MSGLRVAGIVTDLQDVDQDSAKISESTAMDAIPFLDL